MLPATVQFMVAMFLDTTRSANPSIEGAQMGPAGTSQWPAGTCQLNGCDLIVGLWNHRIGVRNQLFELCLVPMTRWWCVIRQTSRGRAAHRIREGRIGDECRIARAV